MSITSFNPPVRTLMGPGPSDVHPRVTGAMARPCIGHLDPAFVGMMDEIKQMLQYTFQTKNQLTIPVSAPGSAGMEATFMNLLEHGDKAIVCQNGVFGGRMKENVERCGATAIMVQDDWGKPVDPQKVEDVLKANPDAKLVAFVHAETSTGARSDAETISRIAHDIPTGDQWYVKWISNRSSARVQAFCCVQVHIIALGIAHVANGVQTSQSCHVMYKPSCLI